MPRADLKRTVRRRAASLAACALAALALVCGGDAYAQSADPNTITRMLEQIERQEARLNAQERLLSAQQRQLGEQRALIERQRDELLTLQGAPRRRLQAPPQSPGGGAIDDNALSEMRGAGPAHYPGLISYNDLGVRSAPIANPRRALQRMDENAGAGAAAPITTPHGPVGEAPPQQETVVVEALPEGQSALLGRGQLVIEPSIEYSRSSSNRLVFRGVEIVSGIQIGLLEANNTARDTVSAAVSARYAVTNRLELEARVPYVYRSDRITTVSQNNAAVTQTFELDGADLGDVEVSARYQLNSGARGAPIFVAGARVKSDSGRGPFDLDRDASGVSTELATGSGFWGVQGSLSVLYPSEPAVLFANVGYLHNIERDIGRTVGAVFVGEVDPGDSISAGFGFGFALNPRFSYSLGYAHSYVMETFTELNNTRQRSAELQIGSLQLGMSFRATERTTISASVNAGVTEDAPDVSVSFRTPIRW